MTTDSPVTAPECAVDMWRLRLAKGTGMSGGGEWSYYESRDDIESALFAAVVEMKACESPRTREAEREKRRWWHWRQLNGGDDVSQRWFVQRIVAVEHLVDGEWVDTPWSITPPVLTLGAEGCRA